ncbi:hypothetical protein BGZ98_000173 [Dissophora globulifera]|nr:hypothetical protein BGZ98_000173 [Dissophora globulifera]
MSASKNALLATFKHITRRAAGGSVPQITKPILSAPMNGWSGNALCAAVANHGGLPVYPIGYYTDPDVIVKDLQSLVPLLKNIGTDKEPVAEEQFLPYAVGFVSFWLERQGPELLYRLLRGEADQPGRTSSPPRVPAAVWFAFGDYKPYLKLVREHGVKGTKIIVQVGSVTEALEAQEENVDVIVLQGTEAGGHGAQRVAPLMTLLPEAYHLLQKRANAAGSKLKMPAVLAAGGISTAIQFKAIELMGASGAVIGTGFMPTFEAPGPQNGKDILLAAVDGNESTVRTRIFDELREFDWPQGYDGRVVRNSVTRREEEDLKQHGRYEQTGQAAFKLLNDERTGVREDYKRAVKENNWDLLPLWCGTGVGLLNKQVSAAEFMDSLLDNKQ